MTGLHRIGERGVEGGAERVSHARWAVGLIGGLRVASVVAAVLFGLWERHYLGALATRQNWTVDYQAEGLQALAFLVLLPLFLAGLSMGAVGLALGLRPLMSGRRLGNAGLRLVVGLVAIEFANAALLARPGFFGWWYQIGAAAAGTCLLAVGCRRWGRGVADLRVVVGLMGVDAFLLASVPVWNPSLLVFSLVIKGAGVAARAIAVGLVVRAGRESA